MTLYFHGKGLPEFHDAEEFMLWELFFGLVTLNELLSFRFVSLDVLTGTRRMSAARTSYECPSAPQRCLSAGKSLWATNIRRFLFELTPTLLWSLTFMPQWMQAYICSFVSQWNWLASCHEELIWGFRLQFSLANKARMQSMTKIFAWNFLLCRQ